MILNTKVSFENSQNQLCQFKIRPEYFKNLHSTLNTPHTPSLFFNPPNSSSDVKEKRKKFISQQKGISKFGSSECADVQSDYDRSIKRNSQQQTTLRQSIYNNPLLDQNLKHKLEKIIEMDFENETGEENKLEVDQIKRNQIQQVLRKSLLPEVENLGSMVIGSVNDEFEGVQEEPTPKKNKGIVRHSIIKKYNVHWKKNAVSCKVLNEIEELIKEKNRIDEDVQDLRGLRQRLDQMKKLENSKNRKKSKKSRLIA